MKIGYINDYSPPDYFIYSIDEMISILSSNSSDPYTEYIRQTITFVLNYLHIGDVELTDCDAVSPDFSFISETVERLFFHWNATSLLRNEQNDSTALNSVLEKEITKLRNWNTNNCPKPMCLYYNAYTDHRSHCAMNCPIYSEEEQYSPIQIIGIAIGSLFILGVLTFVLCLFCYNKKSSSELSVTLL